MIRKLSLLLLVSLLLVLLPGIGSAQESDPAQLKISNQQLMELEQIFNQLDSTTMQQSENWTDLSRQLAISKALTNNLQTQVQDYAKLNNDLKQQVISYQQLTKNLNDSLVKAKLEVTETRNALKEANESFSKYEKQTKEKIKSLERERNLSLLGIIALAVVKNK